MPRALARLRYRKPAAPIVLPAYSPDNPAHNVLLEQRVVALVDRQSHPQTVKLQVAVNAKAKPPPAGIIRSPPHKPYTLRDIVDPKGESTHGQIIYVFVNIRTNQIIYSLQELLDNHHLDQLPFIGKHSKPPAIRPDEWAPHCVITFPTPEQGHNAYRKLREFRKLHEASWEKTNPEFKSISLKERIKKIMDQRGNMSADLAAVLQIQAEHGDKMANDIAERKERVEKYMNKKWPEVIALDQAVKNKEKLADRPKWLEHQIRSLTFQANMKHNQNEADQKRLHAARKIHEVRLKKVQYAIRKAKQLREWESDLRRTAAPAAGDDAETRLATLKLQVTGLNDALRQSDPARTKEKQDLDRALLHQCEADIAALEPALVAKAELAARDHYIPRSILPPQLRAPLRAAYTLDGVRVRWADIQDASYAKGSWPESIEHEALDLSKTYRETTYYYADDYAIEKEREVSKILRAIQEAAEPVPEPEFVEPEPESKIMKYLPEIKNPFKRAVV